MKFRVRELARAKADKRRIIAWLRQRSPQGAANWLAAYDSMIERLMRSADAFASAHEGQRMNR